MKLGTVGWAVVIGVIALGATVWVGSRVGMIPTETVEDEIQKPEDAKGPPISPTPPYPAVFFEGGSEYKFGLMAVGDRGEHVFVIKNTGEAPLIVQQGATSCKCTLSEFGGKELVQEPDPVDPKVPPKRKERKTIDPGKTIEVKLSWHAEKPMQPFSQAASFLTNDPQNKLIKAYVNGEVVDMMTLSPLEEWNVGAISEEEPAKITGYLYSQILDNFKIDSLETSSDAIKVETTPVDAEVLAKNKAKSGYKIDVSIDPTIPVGRLKETLKISTIAGSEQKKFEIPVKGYRPGPFRILPVSGVTWRQDLDLLDFGTISSAQTVFSLPFFVKDMNEGQLQMTGFESDVPDLKVRLDSKVDENTEAKKRYQLVIEFPAGRMLNRNIPPYSTVTVKTNHPKAPEMKLFLKFVSL